MAMTVVWCQHPVAKITNPDAVSKYILVLVNSGIGIVA